MTAADKLVNEALKRAGTNSAVLTYLNVDLGLSGVEDLFNCAGNVFGSSDLLDAKQRGSTGIVVASDPDLFSQAEIDVAGGVVRQDLDDAVVKVEEILKSIFGDNAFVSLAVREDRETGNRELVIEAHYSYSAADPDGLVRRHEQFFEKYIEQVAPAIQSAVSLVWFASDAAQS